MGFRKGAFATVQDVDPRSDSFTKLRISISRKDRESDSYVTDFSGYVSCVGTLTAKKAANLTEKDRIRLGDVDVTNRYDKEKGITYTNYTVFGFDTQKEFEHDVDNGEEPSVSVDDGEFEDNRLPFQSVVYGEYKLSTFVR